MKEKNRNKTKQRKKEIKKERDPVEKNSDSIKLIF